jgi:hypothetical protein
VDWRTITNVAFAAANKEFLRLVEQAMTDGQNLYLLFGYVEHDNFAFIADWGTGEFEQRMRNVSTYHGKLSTVVRFGCDSAIAYASAPQHSFFGDTDNPRRWRGGVYLPTVHTRPDGTHVWINLAGAADGDQRIVDEFITRAALNAAAFEWLRQQRAFDEAQNS